MDEYIPHDMVIQKARVNPAHIGYINSIVESYEGIGQVRTLDNKLGIIVFWIMPDHEPAVRGLLEEFQRDLGLTLLEEERPS